MEIHSNKRILLENLQISEVVEYWNKYQLALNKFWNSKIDLATECILQTATNGQRSRDAWKTAFYNSRQIQSRQIKYSL